MSLPPCPKLDESFDDTIIIDGLPKVDQPKFDKLIGFLKKKFELYAPIDIQMPSDEANNTFGFVFMRLETPEKAKAALSMDGKPMDKVHTFRITPFSEMDKYENVPETYTPLKVDDIKQKPLPYMNDFLLDQQGREQVMFRFQDEEDFHHTHVSYVDTHNDEIFVPSFTAEDRVRMGKPLTHLASGFSPKGSFLYTFHEQGIALWAGASYERTASIAHPNPAAVAFSPCERYVVTMSEQPSPSVLCDVAVWDVASSQPIVRYNTILRDQQWPFFKWSFDGNFFGRVANKKEEIKDKEGRITEVKFTPIGIAVYDMNKREVITGRPIPAPNLVDFQFSPTGPELAYCMVGKDMQPSRLVIYDVEKRREIRNNPSFGVEKWQLLWQASGDHLLAYIERKVNKHSTVFALDIYFVKKKNCPLVEHTLTKSVTKLQVSPTSNKILTTSFQISDKSQSKAEFAVLTFTEQAITPIWSEIIPVPSQADLTKLTSVFQTEWSPQGDTFFIATFTNAASVAVYDASKAALIELVAAELQLAHANKIQWDYSGRYFALASLHDYPQKNAKKSDFRGVPSRFQLYNFQGVLVHEIRIPHLFTFEWRPQPILALTSAQQDQVKHDLRSKYWSRFESTDDAYEKNKRGGVAAKRNELKAAWKEMRNACLKVYKDSHDIRAEFYGGFASDDDNEDDYEVVEISRTQKVIKHIQPTAPTTPE